MLHNVWQCTCNNCNSESQCSWHVCGNVARQLAVVKRLSINPLNSPSARSINLPGALLWFTFIPHFFFFLQGIYVVHWEGCSGILLYILCPGDFLKLYFVMHLLWLRYIWIRYIWIILMQWSIRVLFYLVCKMYTNMYCSCEDLDGTLMVETPPRPHLHIHPVYNHDRFCMKCVCK